MTTIKWTLLLGGLGLTLFFAHCIRQARRVLDFDVIGDCPDLPEDFKR